MALTLGDTSTTNTNTVDKKLYNGIDEETLKTICNPALAAFNAGLDAMIINPSLENLNEIHLALLIDFSQTNNKILKRIPELIEFLDYEKYPQFYNEMCKILSDISHYNELVTNILLNLNIFEKLDSKNELTFELIFSIADRNEKARKQFFISEFFKTNSTDQFKNHQKIQMLWKQL